MRNLFNRKEREDRQEGQKILEVLKPIYSVFYEPFAFLSDQRERAVQGLDSRRTMS
jgi:hypothetical protein